MIGIKLLKDCVIVGGIILGILICIFLMCVSCGKNFLIKLFIIIVINSFCVFK